MNTQEFINKVRATGSKYFSPANMQFAGDTMHNMHVKKVQNGYILTRDAREWLSNRDFIPEPTFFDSNFNRVDSLDN